MGDSTVDFTSKGDDLTNPCGKVKTIDGVTHVAGILTESTNTMSSESCEYTSGRRWRGQRVGGAGGGPTENFTKIPNR